MPEWSIKIISTGGVVKLKPDIEDADPGDPLDVEQGDLVSWNNTTDQTYWPIPVSTTPSSPPSPPPSPTAPPPAELTHQAIAPRSPSPYFNVTQPAGTTINYCLKDHPEVQGKLVVVPFGFIRKKVVA